MTEYTHYTKDEIMEGGTLCPDCGHDAVYHGMEIAECFYCQWTLEEEKIVQQCPECYGPVTHGFGNNGRYRACHACGWGLPN